MAEYEVFIGYLDEKGHEIERGDEVIIEVKDMTSFLRKIVRAKITNSREKLPEGEKLWIRDWMENKLPEPWYISICEELDPDEFQAQRSDASPGTDEYKREDKGYQKKYMGDGLAPGYLRYAQVPMPDLGKSKIGKR